MNMTTRVVEVAFLTSGPRLKLDIPSDFSPMPYLSSPITIGNGEGRSLDFRPNVTLADPRLGPDQFEELAPIERSGMTTHIFRRLEEPIVWVLAWELPTGLLTTHLRDASELALVPIITEQLTIDAEHSRPPTVIPNHPLARAASRQPGWQESMTFLPSDEGDHLSIRLTRPGGLKSGQRQVLSENAAVSEARGGSRLGIDITVTGRLAKDQAASIVDQLRAGITF